ncbi:MAG: ABC transporter substrate-binding protein [Cycloclasticus sp. symbiont of Bathymodiolus heckerae]|nr:MAG: ABC transporter substrate-binding protein [Cycloclasticus sp. symbiont of Bathymodiolus heckerae]
MQPFLKTQIIFLIFVMSATFSHFSFAESTHPIKISVLKFGTINWTLETIKNSGLDEKNNFKLIVQPLASTQASKIALQANATDIIASDWTWVARQRGSPSNYLFAPYSSSAGSIMVPAQSTIQSIDDLVGKNLGIAGRALDKNWLLLRTLALRNGIDLNKAATKTFGAPPLLNNLIQRNELDALINFWHYSARLKAKGYRELISTHGIIHQLGIHTTVPILGYVFNEEWANKNTIQLNGFLSASREAADLLCTSDKHWNAILPLTRAKDKTTQQMLRNGYCKGRITHFGQKEKQAISDIYTLLYKVGGQKLIGSVKTLDPNLFWNETQH